MEMDQHIPDLSDKELESLHANAVRLAQSGAPQQRRQSEELLPLLGAALEERRRARVASLRDASRHNARRSAIVGQSMKTRA